MKSPILQQILFLKVKNLDKEAYGQFYDLYAPRIYRFVFFKVNSVGEAQDLTSEVFLKLWQALKEGKEIDNLNSFIYTMARNAVIDHYRARANRRLESLDEPEILEEADSIIDDRRDLLQEQMSDFQLKEVLTNLDKLKDEYKEVIVLKFLDELSIGEIAEVLNKSNGSVRVLLHRALNALRNNINGQ
ncbi:MAG: RNA polymerase sigma factor [bacterium]